MNIPASITRLPGECRGIVLTLLGHRALKRLGAIKQLGFSDNAYQTRLEHTLDSLQLAIGFLEKDVRTSAFVRNHLFAAITLEDIGRAPFSNSLDPVFPVLGHASANIPVDVQRSLSVLSHLEREECILSQFKLDAGVVLELVRGKVPWEGAGWVKSLLNGPTDIDRLAYVRGDLAHVKGQHYGLGRLAGSIILDGHGPAGVVDQSALDAVVDFLYQRARLYFLDYYRPEKLALEFVVRLFLRRLWEFAEGASDEWKNVREPRTVDSFLLWSDGTVIEALDGERWSRAAQEIRSMRGVIRDGGLQVAELRESGAVVVDIDKIDLLLAEVRGVLTTREHCWLLDSRQLPIIQAYQPGTLSLLVKGGHHLPLEKTAEFRANAELKEKMRRCPLIIFPAIDYAAVQQVLEEGGLDLLRPHNLKPMSRRVF